MWLILVLYMVLASAFTFGKAVLAYTQPIFFIGIRMVFAGIILLGYTYMRTSTLPSIRMRHAVPLFVQIIFFHIYLTYICEFVALQYVTSWKASLLFNLSPFITALFSYHFFQERLGVQKWLGLALGCVGFIPVLIMHGPTEGASLFFISWPEFLLLISVVSSVHGWLVMKKLIGQGYNPIYINGVGMFIGGTLALLTSLVVETGPRLIVHTTMLHTLALFCGYTMGLILVANIIFYNLYGFLLQRYSATLLSFAGFTCPLFTAFYGWLFLGEQVQGWFFLSILMIFGGLYIFYRDELAQVRG